MIRLKYSILPACLLLGSCTQGPDKASMEKWKQEVVEAEQNFAKMAGEVGMHDAFVAFAAEDAVIMRNDELVTGKKNIDMFYEKRTSKGLTWAPDFVDVAASGDLGYTYGHYTFSFVDSTGTTISNTGIFHTVWKRQADGSWKFVWD